MKPGDHPEFFRFPAPEGTSRESTIRLDRDGRFSHDGEPVERRDFHEALHRWLAIHPDDLRPILSNGYDWCYLTVDDTFRFVTGVKGAPPTVPVLVMADGTEEPLDASTLTVDEHGGLFARVRGGSQAARFLRLAQVELGPWVSADEPAAVLIDGTRQLISPREKV